MGWNRGNWPEHNIEPLLANLACPNQRNKFYKSFILIAALTISRIDCNQPTTQFANVDHTYPMRTGHFAITNYVLRSKSYL